LSKKKSLLSCLIIRSDLFIIEILGSLLVFVFLVLHFLLNVTEK
jgi:hypothetical protein